MAPTLFNKVFQYTHARNWIRWPATLCIPLVWGYTITDLVDERFKSWNNGHNQVDIWNRVQAKVAAMPAEEEE